MKVSTTTSILETPRDGKWYIINETEDTTTVIKWDSGDNNWMYIAMRDEDAIDHGRIDADTEIII